MNQQKQQTYEEWLDGWNVPPPDPNESVDSIMARLNIHLSDGSYESLLQRYEKKAQRSRARARKR